jgi:hypothetical protein
MSFSAIPAHSVLLPFFRGIASRLVRYCRTPLFIVPNSLPTYSFCHGSSRNALPPSSPFACVRFCSKKSTAMLAASLSSEHLGVAFVFLRALVNG